MTEAGGNCPELPAGHKAEGHLDASPQAAGAVGESRVPSSEVTLTTTPRKLEAVAP